MLNLKKRIYHHVASTGWLFFKLKIEILNWKKLKRELAKVALKDEINEVSEVASSIQEIVTNLRSELEKNSKKSKERISSSSETLCSKIDDLRNEFKADFKIFIKNNANSGLISTIEEVRSFSADLGDRIENIEDALEDIHQDLNKEPDENSVHFRFPKILWKLIWYINFPDEQFFVITTQIPQFWENQVSKLR